MPETVYEGPPQEGEQQPEHPAKRQNAWSHQLRQPGVIALLALLVLLLIFVVHSLTKQEPPPLILGASQRSIALSSNGQVLAVGTLDGTLRLLAVESGHTLAKTQLPSAVTALSFGPDSSLLVLTQGQPTLYIYSADLSAHAERTVQPNPRDVVWSDALDAAILVGAGRDGINPNLEFFPRQPMGIAQSTSQLFDLRAWNAPLNLSVSRDGSRVAVTLATGRQANVIFYDPKARRVAASGQIKGTPKGVAMAQDGMRAWVVSSDDEAITEIDPRKFVRTEFPKAASTSPLYMIAVSETVHRAYTTGALTFPEVDLDHNKIVRTFELLTPSAGIVLSPDGSTAYLTFQSVNRVGVLNLQDMRTYREIELR